MSGITGLLEQLVRGVLAESDASIDHSLQLDINRGLIVDYGLSSVALIKLVVGIERQFGIELADDHLNTDNFQSIAAIGALLESEYAVKP